MIAHCDDKSSLKAKYAKRKLIKLLNIAGTFVKIY